MCINKYSLTYIHVVWHTACMDVWSVNANVKICELFYIPKFYNYMYSTLQCLWLRHSNIIMYWCLGITAGISSIQQWNEWTYLYLFIYVEGVVCTIYLQMEAKTGNKTSIAKKFIARGFYTTWNSTVESAILHHCKTNCLLFWVVFTQFSCNPHNTVWLLWHSCHNSHTCVRVTKLFCSVKLHLNAFDIVLSLARYWRKTKPLSFSP